MLGRISAQSFSFDQNFRPYNSEQFALVRCTVRVWVIVWLSCSMFPNKWVWLIEIVTGCLLCRVIVMFKPPLLLLLWMTQGFFRDPNVVSSLPTQFGAEALLGTSPPACHRVHRELISCILQNHSLVEHVWWACTCVCVDRRQAGGVCGGGAGAVHWSHHGALWPHLLLRGPDALRTHGQMLSRRPSRLRWAETGQCSSSSSSHAHLSVAWDWISLSSSSCCRRRTRSTTTRLVWRHGGSFCFASSSTCVWEASSVSTTTSSTPTSAPPSESTRTWSGARSRCHSSMDAVERDQMRSTIMDQVFLYTFITRCTFAPQCSEEPRDQEDQRCLHGAPSARLREWLVFVLLRGVRENIQLDGDWLLIHGHYRIRWHTSNVNVHVWSTSTQYESDRYVSPPISACHWYIGIGVSVSV